MMRKMSIAVSAALLFTAGAALADPLDGNWRTASGETASISGGAITLKTGKYAGKRIGQFNAAGAGKYTGTITDPADNKTYSGSAKLSGSSLKMTGCALKVFCKSQTWKKM